MDIALPTPHEEFVELLRRDAFEEIHQKFDIIGLLNANNRDKLIELFGLLNFDYTLWNFHLGFCQFIADLLHMLLMNNSTNDITNLNYIIWKQTDYRYYGQIIYNLLLKLHTTRAVDILLHNPWILILKNDPKFHTSGKRYDSSFLEFGTDHTEETMEILYFIISHHQYFDPKDVWKHIMGIFNWYCHGNFSHHDILLKLFTLCADVQIPLLSDNMNAIYCYSNSAFKFDIINIILERDVMPPTNFIVTVIDEMNIPIIKLFIKYNINIKSILEFELRSNLGTQMLDVLEALHLDPSDYVHIVANLKN